jgi:hypothetical protein
MLSGGVEITFGILAHTSNEAAIGVLVAALDSGHRDVQEGAIRALLERRNTEGHRELVRRWDVLNDRWRAMIGERAGRVAAAVRDTVLSQDDKLCANGCHAAVAIREFDLIPSLISVVLEGEPRRSTLTAQAVLELAELLQDELSAPRDYRERRDPQMIRQHFVGSLESALNRDVPYGHAEIVEAFLLLAKSDNSTLRAIMEDVRHASHRAIRDALRTSPRPGVMRVLRKCIEKPAAPSAIMHVLAERIDVPFLRRLAKTIGPELSDVIRHNLRRVDHLALLDDLSLLHALTDAEQLSVMHLIGAVNVPQEQLFGAIQFILREGNSGGRRVAAALLARFNGPEAEQLVLTALDDPDPHVQAAIARQIRERGLPSAIGRLISLLDSPHAVVRTAVQESMSEFTFQRYLAVFDMLDDDVRRTAGMLVRKVDPQTVTLMTNELGSPSRIRRARAIQARAMGAVADLEAELIELLEDDDHFIRAEAAHALGATVSQRANAALQQALNDSSQVVREAAEAAIREMAQPYFAPPLATLDLSSLLTNSPFEEFSS